MHVRGARVRGVKREWSERHKGHRATTVVLTGGQETVARKKGGNFEEYDELFHGSVMETGRKVETRRAAQRPREPKCG